LGGMVAFKTTQGNGKFGGRGLQEKKVGKARVARGEKYKNGVSEVKGKKEIMGLGEKKTYH